MQGGPCLCLNVISDRSHHKSTMLDVAKDSFAALTLPYHHRMILTGLGAYEMTRGDQKDFTANGWKVGIAVLEVTDTEPVLKVADDA